MTSSRARLTAAAAGLLLTLTACGGGGDDAEASKAISDSIMKSQEQQQGGTGDIFAMQREEADCIGEGFVDKIGTEQLQEYGFLTEDLKAAEEGLTDVKMSTEDAEAAADTLLGCADVQQMMTKAMGEVDAKTKECLEGVLTDDALRSLFTKMFSGNQEEAGQELIQPMMKCAAPDLQ
jgi:hypothetical protein